MLYRNHSSQSKTSPWNFSETSISQPENRAKYQILSSARRRNISFSSSQSSRVVNHNRILTHPSPFFPSSKVYYIPFNHVPKVNTYLLPKTSKQAMQTKVRMESIFCNHYRLYHCFTRSAFSVWPFSQ